MNLFCYKTFFETMIIMEDEAVEIMYEESEASQLAFKAIENWASKESQRSELELTGFGAALSNELVNLKSLLP